MQLKFKNNFSGYFLFYYRVVGKKLLLSIFLSITVTVLDGVGLSMFMPLLQTVSGEGGSTQKSMGHLHYITDFITGMGFSLTLGTVLGILVILFSLKGFVKFLELNYQAKVIQFFMKRIRHELVSSLQKISYKGFIQLDAGKIQNTFIAEVQKMSQGAKFYLTYTQSLFMLATYVFLALLANYQFAILVAVSAGLTNLLYTKIYKILKQASFDISKKGHDFNSYMIQAITYFKYLKSTNYLNRYAKNLGQVINKTENLNKKVGFYTAITTGIREPMILLIVVIVIYIQINWMGGSLGSIILSLILFYRALTFLMSIQNQWQSFIQSTGAMRSVTELSATMNNNVEIQGKVNFENIESVISIESIDL